MYNDRICYINNFALYSFFITYLYKEHNLYITLSYYRPVFYFYDFCDFTLTASERRPETSITKSSFENEIANRRNQACRSILVQVYSSNSYDDLQSYCSQFGKILSVHHYRMNKQNVCQLLFNHN